MVKSVRVHTVPAIFPMTRESQPSVDKTWRMVAEPLQDYCANLGMSYRVRLRIFLALVSTPRD